MNDLGDWTTRVAAELGVDAPDVELVLALAKDVAHGVLRPAAPVTAYLVGVAVGRGADPAEAARQVQALIDRHDDLRGV